MDDDDRRALAQLRRDQEYREWLEARRRRTLRNARTCAFVFGSLLGAAFTTAQLLHLLGLF